MKNLLIVFIFTIYLLSSVTCANPVVNKADTLQKKLETLAEKCRTSVNATAADVKDLIADKPAKSKEAKRLHVCVLKELKLVDKNGKFQRPKFLEYAKEYSSNTKFIDVTMKAFDTCSEKLVIKNENCDDVEKFRECIKNEEKKILDGLLKDKKSPVKILKAVVNETSVAK